jgi:hypothetical protein
MCKVGAGAASGCVSAGRPKLPAERRRAQISLRFDPETIAALRALGPGFNAFAEEAIKRALKRRARR